MEPQNNIKQIFARERNVKGLDRAQRMFNAFSITEKVVFLVFTGLFVFAVLSLTYKINSSYMVKVPMRGGELVEGIVGTPRFINPLLAVSDADRDLTALVYSGLLRITPDGKFIPDLAERYVISPDGLSYTFVIRENAFFHDGKHVTADDVIYTVTKAQESSLKSPRRINWEGVVVEKTNDREIIFKLKQPYAPFIVNLAMGIIPKHIWKNYEGDQFPFSTSNIDATGSGPFEIESVERTGDGIPNQITLIANAKYVLGEPYIQKIVLKFYQNEISLLDALSDGVIESAANIRPEMADKVPPRLNILRAPLTRVFGIFFNQNERELLAHREIREALALVIDKESIIKNVLHGYGTPTNSPLPPTLSEKYPNETTENINSSSTLDVNFDKATNLLKVAGWKKNSTTGIYELKNKSGSTTLALSLSTANISELVNSARIIEESWKKLGVKIDVRIFEPSDLNQSVIRPRKYDSLLFGIVTGRNPDLYPFWHSSQRNDPGLNIALYTNAKVDKFLETMRTTTDLIVADEALIGFKKEIANDTPAIFIWSPDFIYVLPKKVAGVSLGEITTPSDRFLNIYKWYIKTDEIWRIFAKNENDLAKNDR
ncbi:MAG: ABC transporter substrate-binding protein [bacterium]|nr:ABC transporter substrate-binding protein [bacterium]